MFDMYNFIHETLPIFGFGFSCFGLGYILGVNDGLKLIHLPPPLTV